MTLGEKINLLRKNKSKELSHEKLAQELDVSKTALIKWEQNKAKPSIENLLKLCNYFEMDFYSLIRGVGNFNFYFDKYKDYKMETNSQNTLTNSLTSPEVIENLINNQKNITDLIQQQNALISKLLEKK